METRKQAGVSHTELERRWQAVRQEMKNQRLDFLVVQNSSPIYCGNVRWLTDMQVSNNPVTVIFPVEDQMTVISHGPRPSPETPQPVLTHGVKKRLSVPMIRSMEFSNTWDAELAVEELGPHKGARVGLVGMGFISAAFYSYILAHSDGLKIVPASDILDELKAVKSEEEIVLTRETCRLQDELWDYALTCTRPGRYEYQVRADLVRRWLELGGEEHSIHLGAAPPGTAARMQPAGLDNRMIQPGDQVNFLVETAGPGGLWGEFARILCLGKAPAKLLEQFELARQTQKQTLDMLKPGGEPLAMWEANNSFLKKVGYPQEHRIYAHGQGYDMMERPSFNPGETMKIKAGMNIAVHPTVRSAEAHAWVCDNYLVKESGPPELIHKTQKKIFEV